MKQEKSNMEEIWVDIKGYEGLYQVCNLGKVKSFPRATNNRERLLSARADSTGYLGVNLCKGGIAKYIRVHRLVAAAFLPESVKTFVNHKNGIKTDNHPENLEWCTNRENIQHAIRTGLSKPNGGKRNKVIVFDLLNKTKEEYPSIKEASDRLGIGYAVVIGGLRRGSTVNKRYRVMLHNDQSIKIDPASVLPRKRYMNPNVKRKRGKDHHKSQRIAQKDFQGNTVNIFYSLSEAAASLGATTGHISKVVNGQTKSVYGFKFERL